MTLYQIKPLFQSLLRPTMFWLYKHHVTANHITLAALALSLLTGLLLVLVAQPILFLLLPIVLFIRMTQPIQHFGDGNTIFQMCNTFIFHFRFILDRLPHSGWIHNIH